MGEARYYMKISCYNGEYAERIFPKIKALFEEGEKAENYWQDNRGENVPKEKFWEQFEEMFPLVTEYLKFNTIRGSLFGGDKNNALSGHLNFGYEDDRYISLDGKCILISAEVWHFADWDTLSYFLSRKYEKEIYNVNWLSDEYSEPNYFDML